MFYRDQLGVHIASQAGDLGQAVVWQVIIWEQVIQSLPPPPRPQIRKLPQLLLRCCWVWRYFYLLSQDVYLSEMLSE